MAKAASKKAAGAAKKPRRRKAPDPVEPELWEQQPGESAPAFQAFAVYRDLGPGRSIRAAGRSLGKARQTLEAWASPHKWVSRASAWDGHLDEIARKELEEQRAAAGKRHATVLRGQMNALSAPAAELLRRLEDTPDLLAKMPLNALAALAVQGARATPRLVIAERLALGVSTENLGAHDGGAFTAEQEKVKRMSDPEVDAYLVGRRDEAALASAEREAARELE